MNLAPITAQKSECEIGMCYNWIIGSRFRLARTFDLAPLQHLQPGGPGVFPKRRYEVTPYEGASLLVDDSQG
jgi:hypothetical protein